MLIEFTESPIKLDGEPILKDLRMNFQPTTRQARLKFTCIGKAETVPVDLLIWSIGKVSVSGVTAEITVSGTEVYTASEFQLKIQLSLIQRIWKVTGRIGGHTIDTADRSISRVLNSVKMVIVAINATRKEKPKTL